MSKDWSTGFMKAKFGSTWFDTVVPIIQYENDTIISGHVLEKPAAAVKCPKSKTKKATKERAVVMKSVKSKAAYEKNKAYSLVYHRTLKKFLSNRKATVANKLKAKEMGRKARRKATENM